MTTPKLYKHKSSARAAALKALGIDGQFEVVMCEDGQFYWIDLSEAAAEAAGAENDSHAELVKAENEVSIPLPPPEPFEEPEEKANLKVELGITPELAALIYGLGDLIGAAIPVPEKRKGITTDAWAAAERGELPGPLCIPPSNMYAQIHADNLHILAQEMNAVAVANYPIGGTNTYSKALRSYRDALLCYLNYFPEALKEAA